MFQSTHSLRSATVILFCPPHRLNVSIHALLAECDIINGGTTRNNKSFNPRTPCGVRRLKLSHAARLVQFQSTHSLRSATHQRGNNPDNENVSIHALLAECDRCGRRTFSGLLCFNPRTPCGVRQMICEARECGGGFQSTHSLRSATDIFRGTGDGTRVSIHALLAECDATDFIHYYSTEQIILCANLPKKTVIARLHFLSIYLSIFYSQCITPIADLPGNSCELEVGAQAMFHSL